MQLLYSKYILLLLHLKSLPSFVSFFGDILFYINTNKPQATTQNSKKTYTKKYQNSFQIHC